MIRLSERLQAIAEMCAGSVLVADVGCDHAYIPIYLLETGRIKTALAMDVNSGPLRNAADNARREGVQDSIRFIQSDGLDKLPEDIEFSPCDTLLIAGMGGELIERILADGSRKAACFGSFVFSPHTKLPEFRHFLGKSGYRISDERVMCEDGKFYTIIKAVHGADACHESFDYEFGPFFLENRNAAYREAIGEHIQQLENVLDGRNHVPEERRAALTEELVLYRKAQNMLDAEC